MNSTLSIKSESPFRPLCLHSRNIMAYIDLNESDLSVLPFGKHLVVCPVCQDEFLKAKKVLNQIEKYIPLENMASEQSELMSKEVSQMMRRVKLKEFEKGWLKIQLLAQGSKAAFTDILRTIVSPQMGLVYVGALFLGLAIRYFQS